MVGLGSGRSGRIDKLPVILGGLVGVPLAIWLAPRRVLTPLATLVLLVLVFVAEGAAGASVIDRYLMGAATVLLLFCAVTIGGWAMLEPGSLLRRVWMAGAAVLILYGAAGRHTLSLSSLRTTLAYHEDFHKGLAVALHDPALERALKRCPLLSLPEQQADPRRPLDPRHRRTARHRRAQPGAGRRRQGGVRAGGPDPSAAAWRCTRLGSAVFVEAIVDVGDDPLDQVPLTRLQTDLHEPLLRGLCQLLRPRPPALGLAGARGVLLGGLGLRLWGVAQGLPYVYDIDEADHFVPHAVAMFEQHSLNPHYFANPPAFTYVLHFLFALAYGGAAACATRSQQHPGDCTRSRGSPPRCSASPRSGCSTLTGARLFGRAVGLLAAAIEAVAFLPVFYAHLALNDVPTLAPLTLSLLGTAGVLRKGRARDHLLAGVGSVWRARASTPPGSCSCR